MEMHLPSEDTLGTGGTIAFVSTILMNLWNWLSVDHINMLLVFITSFIGIGYGWYRLKGVILDNKLKYYELKKKRFEHKKHKKDESAEN